MNKLKLFLLMFGPLIGRCGKATIAKPGGDKIGRRRLDTHFLGFKYLGATFVHDEERNVYQIQAKKLKGCYMLLDEASVTGTANIIMASVLAEGTTTIYNAACEPYIQQLCHLLNAMGAQISGIASNLITIVVNNLKYYLFTENTRISHNSLSVLIHYRTASMTMWTLRIILRRFQMNDD